MIPVVTGFQNQLASCRYIPLGVTLWYDVNLILLRGFSRIKIHSLPQQMVMSSSVSYYKTNS